MLFNRNLYYKYIRILENLTIIAFIAYCFVAIVVGAIFLEEKGILMGFAISFISGYPTYLILRIKVEDMKWKLDIYDKIDKNVQN